MNPNDRKLSLRHVKLAKDQSTGDISLPVCGVKECGCSDALVKHDVRVVAQLNGDTCGQCDENGGQGVTAMVEQLAQRRGGAGPTRLLPVAGIQSLIDEQSHGEEDERPGGHLRNEEAGIRKE